MRSEAEDRELAGTVERWIAEAHGREVSQLWGWECTPMPCGFPSDEQLAEGLALACGEVTIGELLRRSYEALASSEAPGPATKGDE